MLPETLSNGASSLRLCRSTECYTKDCDTDGGNKIVDGCGGSICEGDVS